MTAQLNPASIDLQQGRPHKSVDDDRLENSQEKANDLRGEA